MNFHGTICAALAALLLPFGGALAGDYADLQILGFSPDGRTFAFEEYGVQDGSGFPYSNIYVIDTASDDWVAGTPVRMLDQTDGAPLAGARAKALASAKSILAARKVGASGNLVASNPVTELSADPHHVIFLPRLLVPSGGTAYDLQLTEIKLPAGDCPTDTGSTFRGFRLVLTAASGPARTLAEDKQIPASRKCPVGYAMSEVLTLYPENGAPVLAVVLSMFTLGFEGPDRRFIAVTAPLPQ